MDVKKFCEESIEHCNECIAEERLSGNVVKKAHFVGGKSAYQSVISALLDSESTEKSPNKTHGAEAEEITCWRCKCACVAIQGESEWVKCKSCGELHRK